ncbi:MAG: S-layer homology domain-containing protein [Armatimonadetes bacterium]|nr:S-layer homology domain-containing protein [Armatimonadota bacterium]
MKKTVYLLAVVALLCGAAALAQGPFNDVPTDHWAYDAINQLQKDGVLIGYPDGTFAGKRAITRYEFAAAIARIIRMIPGPAAPVTQQDLSAYVKKSELPDFSKFATKADLEALKKLMDEFRGELAALGVDVDALKRDVAALDARVCMLEAEQRRVKITGDVNAFAVATDHRSGVVPAYDRDERPIPTNATLGRTIGVVKDFDLNIVGRVSTATTANATVNYGNYLNYLAFVDDYAGGVFGPPTPPGAAVGPVAGTANGVRPTTRGGNSTVRNSLSDVFFPYYLYISAGAGKGALTVGRFPMQFTPYTLKKIDVDSYTSILKTDDGDYPVDGARLGYNFGGVDLTLFAAKHDTNDFLRNGLTGQPASGIYDAFIAGAKPMHTLGGNGVGGLITAVSPVTQSAGARAVIGIPWSGNLGLTFYQVWSGEQFNVGADYDQAQVLGADVNIPFSRTLGIAGSWTQSNTLARNGASVDDIDFDNQQWDARVIAALGRLGMGVGYKSIGHNFAAAGAWDKIGRWTNPTNIKGPYADISYPVVSNVKLVLNGEWLKIKDPTVNTGNSRLTQDDVIAKAEGGIRWGISRINALDLGYEWVRYHPDAPGVIAATETYLTVGLAHQFGNAGLKLGYQFINYLPSNSPGFAYGSEVYRGGLGVVQFGVSF